MTLHEGRYTMTYIHMDGRWQIIMQHNKPAGDDPLPVRNLRQPGRKRTALRPPIQGAELALASRGGHAGPLR